MHNVKNGKYCVVNNTYEPQSTTVYKGDGTKFDLDLEAMVFTGTKFKTEEENRKRFL